jgi:hypothetical protein
MTTDTSKDRNTSAVPAVCSEPDCGNRVVARGLCMKHYKRTRRHGSTAPTRMSNQGKDCSVDGCPSPAYVKGLCEMHYERVRQHGEPGPVRTYRGLPVLERARRKIDTSAGPDLCHPWTGSLIQGLPTVYDGGRAGETKRSVRRLVAQDAGLLADGDDRHVSIRPSCDPLCCNVRHMSVGAGAQAQAGQGG